MWRRSLVLAGVGHRELASAAVADVNADDDLMVQYRAGDERAFEVLYHRHANSIHGYLRRLVGDAALAEDLLQVTFLSVVRGRGRCEPRVNLRAWLFAVATNAARDALRRARRRREERREVPEAHVDPVQPDPPAARALQEALAELPADQREAVLLHKMHGLSFPEIAEALGIGISAAKVRAHRGYEKLRARLAALADAA
jgi:RNA polymerase sigma factor (sigma-70 family)